MPAYIVFGDATLRALAEHRPASLADLDGVTGIGAKKREAYGEAVLEVIAGGECRGLRLPFLATGGACPE